MKEFSVNLSVLTKINKTDPGLSPHAFLIASLLMRKNAKTNRAVFTQYLLSLGFTEDLIFNSIVELNAYSFIEVFVENETKWIKSTKKFHDLFAEKSYPEVFDKMWNICKRGSKQKAIQQHSKSLEKALEAGFSVEMFVEAWKYLVENTSETKFVPHFENWLKNNRWEEFEIEDSNTEVQTKEIDPFDD